MKNNSEILFEIDVLRNLSIELKDQTYQQWFLNKLQPSIELIKKELNKKSVFIEKNKSYPINSLSSSTQRYIRQIINKTLIKIPYVLRDSSLVDRNIRAYLYSRVGIIYDGQCLLENTLFRLRDRLLPNYLDTYLNVYPKLNSDRKPRRSLIERIELKSFALFTYYIVVYHGLEAGRLFLGGKTSKSPVNFSYASRTYFHCHHPIGMYIVTRKNKNKRKNCSTQAVKIIRRWLRVYKKIYLDMDRSKIKSTKRGTRNKDWLKDKPTAFNYLDMIIKNRIREVRISDQLKLQKNIRVQAYLCARSLHCQRQIEVGDSESLKNLIAKIPYKLFFKTSLNNIIREIKDKFYTNRAYFFIDLDDLYVNAGVSPPQDNFKHFNEDELVYIIEYRGITSWYEVQKNFSLHSAIQKKNLRHSICKRCELIEGKFIDIDGNSWRSSYELTAANYLIDCGFDFKKDFVKDKDYPPHPIFNPSQSKLSVDMIHEPSTTRIEISQYHPEGNTNFDDKHRQSRAVPYLDRMLRKKNYCTEKQWPLIIIPVCSINQQPISHYKFLTNFRNKLIKHIPSIEYQLQTFTKEQCQTLYHCNYAAYDKKAFSRYLQKCIEFIKKNDAYLNNIEDKLLSEVIFTTLNKQQSFQASLKEFNLKWVWLGFIKRSKLNHGWDRNWIYWIGKGSGNFSDILNNPMESLLHTLRKTYNDWNSQCRGLSQFTARALNKAQPSYLGLCFVRMNYQKGTFYAFIECPYFPDKDNFIFNGNKVYSRSIKKDPINIFIDVLQVSLQQYDNHIFSVFPVSGARAFFGNRGVLYDLYEPTFDQLLELAFFSLEYYQKKMGLNQFIIEKDHIENKLNCSLLKNIF